MFNDKINNSEFLDDLKLAELTAIFTKGDSTKSKNYRPVSVLPRVSKMFERIMSSQMSIFVENFLSLLCVSAENVLVYKKPCCLCLKYGKKVFDRKEYKLSSFY